MWLSDAKTLALAHYIAKSSQLPGAYQLHTPCQWLALAISYPLKMCRNAGIVL
jgi:hypothetical protein